MKLLQRALLALLFLGVGASTQAQEKDYTWKEASSAGYTYRYVTNDPTHARFYTLDNGLTVILSPSHQKPRIQCYVAVKAGSKTDPTTHTGLAHYLEHMLFKGTDKFGTLDWAKEKPLIDKITELYEGYNKTTDEAKRKEIYSQIDKVSGEAAKYAIANEYDKLMANMGATGTNAFTSFEQTVYTDDIPSNAIDKYLAVQGERFRHPVFRLFHTELEAVYEEKNRSLDSDGSRSFQAMFKALFPNNNYGKQTTIGTIEDLKNPSLEAIRQYFNTYYVPNNMGIIMAGDFDPDKMIAKIAKTFAYMQPKPIPAYDKGGGFSIKSPIEKEVWGPNPENVMIGFRFPGASTKDARLLSLVGEMLTNGQAGLIDLDLVKKQKLLGAYAFAYPLKDYSVLLLQGRPTEGQSLEEVKNLLLQEITKLRQGDFSETLIQSIVNNEKKSIIETDENYGRRASELMDDFVSGVDHKASLDYINEISNLTKQDIIDFANKYLLDSNYVVVYKRKGEPKNVQKVEKPHITPVAVNRNAQSPFLVKINNMPENKIQPVWLDYNRDIAKNKLGGAQVLSVKNKDNELFRLYYYFDAGKWNNKLLPLAAGYLSFLGTPNQSAEEISKAFYKLASSFNVNAGNEQTYISLDGLDENFEQTLKLFENFIKNAQPDETALKAYKERLLKARANAKQNKGAIMAGLRSYAKYGPENPFNYVLSDAELKAVTAKELVDILHHLFDYEHKILYYGPRDSQHLVKSLKPLHHVARKLKTMAKAKDFKQISTDENRVLFADYDMVQAEVFWVRNSTPYEVEDTPEISLFNNYFGGGMGSIVFQTIRESKALAYSTYAYYTTPSEKDERDSFMAYVGTQADKFLDATTAMDELLTTLPQSDKLLNTSKEGLLKKLASGRITHESILFNYLNAQKLGNNFDVRKLVYEQVPQLNFSNIQDFYQDKISKKPYTYCIVASKEKLPTEKLQQLGKVQKLSLEEIFGY